MQSSFTFHEANECFSKKEFLEFPVRIYKNEKNWIRPLDSDIDRIFNPLQNRFFNHGECIRWILQNEKGDTVGRVAAFVDFLTRDLEDQPTGGMGFFECINDKKVAFALFEKCKTWLENKGIEAMDGPVNFGPRHQWWGLLVEGFEHRPVYNMPFTMPYYQSFFEDYGFKTFFKQFTFRTSAITESLSEVFEWKAKRIFKNPDYIFAHYNKKQADKFIDDFVTIYNDTWVNDIPGAEETTVDEVKESFDKLRPILCPEVMWFAYHKDRPIGFYIIIPDINEILKYLNGKFNWKGNLVFLWQKFFGKNMNSIGLIFGVIPEFQVKGIEAALVKKYTEVVFRKNFKYKSLEMSWVGDFNPRMIHLMDFVGGKKIKTHITYRKLFDETKEFKRSPIIQ